jgi:hypothetical protein
MIHPQAGNNTPPQAVQNPDTIFQDASIPDENSMHSGLEDKSTPSKGPTPKVPRKRGRPQRKIPVLETDSLNPELRRKLRSQSIAGAADDPWVNLSKAPLITPATPSKHKAKPPIQNPVNDPSYSPCNYLTGFQPGQKRGVPQK